MLSTIYPEHQWLPWKFESCHRGYWENMTEQRKYLDWVAKELKIKEFSDWYKISWKVEISKKFHVDFKDIQNLRGGRLLNNYNGSPALMLSTVYPEYDWLPWKFDKCSVGFWGDLNNQRKFLDWAAPQMNIKELSDWYKVSEKVLSWKCKPPNK
jgi:hypothetical protein